MPSVGSTLLLIVILQLVFCWCYRPLNMPHQCVWSSFHCFCLIYWGEKNMFPPLKTRPAIDVFPLFFSYMYVVWSESAGNCKGSWKISYLTFILRTSLKSQCHEIFCHFFSIWISNLIFSTSRGRAVDPHSFFANPVQTLQFFWMRIQIQEVKWMRIHADPDPA